MNDLLRIPRIKEGNRRLVIRKGDHYYRGKIDRMPVYGALNDAVVFKSLDQAFTHAPTSNHAVVDLDILEKGEE